jgi:hypothetical protein
LKRLLPFSAFSRLDRKHALRQGDTAIAVRVQKTKVARYAKSLRWHMRQQHKPQERCTLSGVALSGQNEEIKHFY